MRQNEQLNYANEYAHSYYTSAAKIPTQLLKDTPVSTINFYDCGLKKLPKEVLAFTEIVKLNLSKNQLTELLIELKNLKSLNLSGNPLEVDTKELKKKIQMKLPNCVVVKI